MALSPIFCRSKFRELFFKEHPSPCVSQLRKGFCSLGLYQICKNLPLFVQLMQPSNAPKFSRRKLVTLLHPCFSEEGSNARKYENEVYALFSKYVRETSSGKIEGVTLGHILQFTTCADVEPMLGYKIPHPFAFTQQLPVTNGHFYQQQTHVPKF